MGATISIAHRKDLDRLGDPVALGLIAMQNHALGVIVEIDDAKEAAEQVILYFHQDARLFTISGFDSGLVRRASEKVLGDLSCLINLWHSGVYIPPETGSPYQITWTYQETESGYQVFMKLQLQKAAVN